MKTIGLIGGTTWLSTIDYYRIINQEVNCELGDLHSAKLLLYSIDFDEVRYFAIIQNLIAKGAEAVILGCTEIPLLIKPDDCTVPVFDTTLNLAIAGMAETEHAVIQTRLPGELILLKSQL